MDVAAQRRQEGEDKLAAKKAEKLRKHEAAMAEKVAGSNKKQKTHPT
jgi:hypothetical protein